MMDSADERSFQHDSLHSPWWVLQNLGRMVFSLIWQISLWCFEMVKDWNIW